MRKLRGKRDGLMAEQRRHDEQARQLMQSLGLVERENRNLREENEALRKQRQTGKTLLAEGKSAAGKQLAEGAPGPGDHTCGGRKEEEEKVKGDPGQVVDTVVRFNQELIFT